MRKLLKGDCLERLRELPDGAIDCVIADPPYGTTACKWDSIIPLEPMWLELRRITRPNGAIALFSSQPFTSALLMSNPKQFRHEWVWHKTHGGGFLNANRAPMKRHENVLVFSAKRVRYAPQMTAGTPYTIRSKSAGETTQDQTVAGWLTENKGQRFPTSVLEYASETGLHPTQKPVSLCAYLVRTYTDPGETVLDFCMGSGTTGVAAIREGRDFVGIERDEGYYATARARILAEVAKLTEAAAD